MRARTPLPHLTPPPVCDLAELAAPLNDALLYCFGHDVSSPRHASERVYARLQAAADHADALAVEPCGIHIRTRERADAVRDALDAAYAALKPTSGRHAAALAVTFVALRMASRRVRLAAGEGTNNEDGAEMRRRQHALTLEVDLVLDARMREINLVDGDALGDEIKRTLGRLETGGGDLDRRQGEAEGGATKALNRLRGGALRGSAATPRARQPATADLRLPPTPWSFPGARILYQPTFVRVADAEAVTPRARGLTLLSLFGWTLGGVFAVEWADSPLGPYREVAVLSGLVASSDLRIGAWASHIIVTSEGAAEAGKAIFGLPATPGSIEFEAESEASGEVSSEASAAFANPWDVADAEGGSSSVTEAAEMAWQAASGVALALKMAAGTAVPGVAEPAERLAPAPNFSSKPWRAKASEPGGGGVGTADAQGGGSRGGCFEFSADDECVVRGWGGWLGEGGGEEEGGAGSLVTAAEEASRAGGDEDQGFAISLPSFSGLLPSEDGATPLLRYPLTLGGARRVGLRRAMPSVCAADGAMSKGLRAVLSGPCACPCLVVDGVDVVAGRPVEVQVAK